MRILIIKTSSMGDIIHCLPVVADIHTHITDSTIDWVVEENFANIPHMCGGISNVIPVNIRRWRTRLLSRKTWTEIGELKDALGAYDAVIDCQGLTKSALITRLVHGQTHGFDWHSGRDPFASIFYQQKHAVSLDQDAVARNRALAAKALDYPTPSNTPDYGITLQPPKPSIPIDLKAKYVVALHGTSRAEKLWPESQWVGLGYALAQRQIQIVLPWADHNEQQRAHRIAKQLGNAIVLPKLNITEIAGIIAHAQAVVGLDTGLTHLAVALDIPTIAIYIQTDPALNGVIAGSRAPAINLGGIGKSPSVTEVLEAFSRITT